MKEFILKHRKLSTAVIIAFAFALAAGITFNIMVKPYAVYADGTKVEDPTIITANGKEVVIVENDEIAEQVVRDVMQNYVPEDGDLDSIQIEEDLKMEDKTLFIGVKPPVVMTEEEAVDKIVASNETEKPLVHVTTTSKVDVKEKVEPEVVYEKTDELFEGNIELKAEGTEGEKIVTNEVTLVNGNEDAAEPVDEEIVEEPVNTVMLMGTAERPADTAWQDYSGSEVWDGSGVSGTSLVKYGLKYVGNPYKYGGTSLTNGADCSGFIYSVYRQNGYSVPRMGFYKMGKGVCLAEAKAGDIVYYPGHYAMYMGDGKIVHAYNSRAGITTSSVHAPGKILTIRRLVE